MDRYILADHSCPDDQRAAVVLIHDPEEPEADKLALLRPQMTNLLLFIQVGKTVKCTSEDFVCTVSHQDEVLTPGSYWLVFNGMKIKIVIQEKNERCRRAFREMHAQGNDTADAFLSRRNQMI